MLLARGLAQGAVHCSEKCIFWTHQDQKRAKIPHIRGLLVFQKRLDFLQAKKLFFRCFLRPCISDIFCRFIPCNLSRLSVRCSPRLGGELLCAPKLGMQIRSEFNLNSPNSLRIRSQREFAANSA